jgi:hypothetical protein
MSIIENTMHTTKRETISKDERNARSYYTNHDTYHDTDHDTDANKVDTCKTQENGMSSLFQKMNINDGTNGRIFSKNERNQKKEAKEKHKGKDDHVNHEEKEKWKLGYTKIALPDFKQMEKQYKFTDDDIQLGYSPFTLSCLQNYTPLHSLFFELSATNYNSITFNHKYLIKSLDSVFDLKTKETKKENLFIKFSPLLDICHYCIGKYNLNEKSIKNIPTISNMSSCFPKLLDTNNASYVDCFFYFLSSVLVNNYGFKNGINFYGSFMGIQKLFKANVICDIDYLAQSPFFVKNIGEEFLFGTDGLKYVNHLVFSGKENSRKNKNAICIKENVGDDSGGLDCDDILSLDYADLNNIGDSAGLMNTSELTIDDSIQDLDKINGEYQMNMHERELAGGERSHENIWDSDDIIGENIGETIEDTIDANIENAIGDNDDVCTIGTENSNSSSIESDGNDEMRVHDTIYSTSSSVNDESTVYTTESDSADGIDEYPQDEDSNDGDGDDGEDDESKEEEEEDELFVYIKNYPVNLICLEKCEGTLDKLFDSGKMDEQIAISCMFQICMILITYQKVFHFTHNDLHTNNIMYMNTDEEYLYYKYEDKTYKVPTYGYVFKIIDFGRSIYQFAGKVFCSDSFSPDGDAHTQYNCYPYYDENKKRIDPNYSFDLCRLACSIYDFIYDDDDDNNEELDEFQKIIMRWCRDDDGRNMLYKSNGEERYPNFKLYKMIARTVHKHTPQAQLKHSAFKKFLCKDAEKIKENDVFDIDALPCFAIA